MLDRVPAEGQAIVTYSAREVSFADGEKVNLRVPKDRVPGSAIRRVGQGHHDLAAHRTGRGRPGTAGSESPKRRSWTSPRSRKSWACKAGRTTCGTTRPSRPCWALRLESQSTQPAPTDRAPLFSATSARRPRCSRRRTARAVQKQCREVPSASKCGGPGRLHRELPSGGDPEPPYQHHPVPAGACGPRSAQCERPRGEARRGPVRSAKCGACHVPELKTGAKTACLPRRTS